MGNYVAVIEFEGKKHYSRRQSGCEPVEVRTEIIKSERYNNYYESAKISFTSPFTGKNVSLELSLANCGKSKSIRRIIRTINSYLDIEELRIKTEKYNCIFGKIKRYYSVYKDF